jgi:glycosyltransferase involved in cell wall biosynthesis
MRPVPVAFVSSNPEIGGSEEYLEAILSRLEPEWIATVIVLDQGEFADRLREHGYPVHVVPLRSRAGVPAAALRLRRLLRRVQARVVHANGARAAIVAAIAATGAPARVVWLRVDCGLDGRAARMIARRCDQVVGVSRTVTETFRGRSRRDVHVVYPGLPDFEVDRADGRAIVLDALSATEEVEAIVLSGRLCPPKGQLELLEVAPRILERHPHAHFALLGGENRAYEGFEDRLRDRAWELGIEDRVAFLGHRSALIGSVADAVRFVSGCDLLVAPSMREPVSGWREGFGLSAVEALHVGTPVVGYRNGALPEVLGDCASLVDEGDREALAAAMLRVLEDAALRERLVSCGKRRAEERYRLTPAVEGMKERYLASAR